MEIWFLKSGWNLRFIVPWVRLTFLGRHAQWSVNHSWCTVSGSSLVLTSLEQLFSVMDNFDSTRFWPCLEIMLMVKTHRMQLVPCVLGPWIVLSTFQRPYDKTACSAVIEKPHSGGNILCMSPMKEICWNRSKHQNFRKKKKVKRMY